MVQKLRLKVRLPNRPTLVTRVVREIGSTRYIQCDGFNVPIVEFAGEWIVAPEWQWMYGKGKKHKSEKRIELLKGKEKNEQG